MKELEEKCLKFVVEHYKPGRLNTSEALRKVKGEVGQQKSIGRRLWYSLSGIAAAIVICLGTYIYMKTAADDIVRLTADATMEQFVLPDSTHITLSPHSVLTYNASDFGKNTRNVKMTGRIYFSVFHDEKSPFTVQAGNFARVRVLGTRFEVDESTDSTAVYVNSGRVLFAAQGNDDGIILTKGMAAVLNTGSEMPESKKPTPNPSAWATGSFTYDNTPLSVVLKELSEYFHVNLSANDENKQLSAEFDADNLDDIVEIIEHTLEIKIKRN
jgi:transmembrane sensor